jgi:hypothetical protein
MKCRLFTVVLACVLVLAPLAVSADEGMWPIDELKTLDFKKLGAMGLELSAKELYNGKGKGIAYAIVQIGGGTGTLVSPKGLILTNHHVAFSALQRVSSADDNYIADGFVAGGYGEEIPAPGYRAYILISIEDVTKEMLGALKDEMNDLERYQALEQRTKEIVDKAEKGKDVECRVASFYDGMQYKLFTYFVAKDIRIVYAPPEAIGSYGGDIDNWMWPRHTGDFSFLRAYVAPDGSSAEHAADNVPYEPKVHLAMSSKGVVEDDYTMIIGYPGQTMRYRTSSSVDYHQNFNYPMRIEIFSDMIALFHEMGAQDESVAIKLASLDAMLNNAMKNYQGMLEGFESSRLLERKMKEEKAFKSWLANNPKADEKYGDVLPQIEQLYVDIKDRREKGQVGGLAGFLCQMLRSAMTITRWSEEKVKDDIDREPGYRERDLPRLKQGLQIIQMSYDMETDKRVCAYFMNLAAELPDNQRIVAFDEMIERVPGDDVTAKIDAIVERLYAGTKLHSAEERLRMFELSADQLKAEGDPFIDLAFALRPEMKRMEEQDEAFGGALNKLRPQLIEAYKTWKGGTLYPDANGTMRLTYGVVKGYSPRDAVHYDYMTRLAGVVEKHTGEEPFNCPEKLLHLYKKKDFDGYEDAEIGGLPVDFLSTCDITGGNSGSPILNGRGEVIGAAFDGNYESISADYLFNERLTRSINVDARYILFVLDKFSGARHLLDEMTIH